MTMKNNEPRSATKGEDEDGGEAGCFRDNTDAWNGVAGAWSHEYMKGVFPGRGTRRGTWVGGL
jgi:hypothetical protein